MIPLSPRRAGEVERRQVSWDRVGVSRDCAERQSRMHSDELRPSCAQLLVFDLETPYSDREKITRPGEADQCANAWTMAR
jgi:hypothetical protein